MFLKVSQLPSPPILRFDYHRFLFHRPHQTHVQKYSHSVFSFFFSVAFLGTTKKEKSATNSCSAPLLTSKVLDSELDSSSFFSTQHVLVPFLLAPTLVKHPPFEVQQRRSSYPRHSSYVSTCIPSRMFYISQDCTISHPALKLSTTTQVLSILDYIFFHACAPHDTPPTKKEYCIPLNMFLQSSPFILILLDLFRLLVSLLFQLYPFRFHSVPFGVGRAFPTFPSCLNHLLYFFL